MSRDRMTMEDYVAHQKRVKGIPADKPLATVKIPAPKRRDYARELAAQIVAAKLPSPVLEWTFDSQLGGGGRAWRMDLAWPNLPGKPYLEVDGGAHCVRRQHASDLQKHQAAGTLGYTRIPSVSPAQVLNGEALELVRRALA